MIQSLFRYSMVGAVGTLAHYAVLVALVERARATPPVATAVGFTTGALVNYFLNVRFTFQSTRPHREAMPRFFAAAAAGMAANSGIVALGVNVFRLHYMIPQIVATAVVVIGTFCVNRAWTFQRKSA